MLELHCSCGFEQCAWAFVFISERVHTRVAAVSALQVGARSCLSCLPDSGDVNSSVLWSMLDTVSLFHWVTQAVTDYEKQQRSITLNTPVPRCCKHSVLQVTLRRSPSAAIVYSCGVRPVRVKMLVMAYKDGALISVW